MSIELKGKLEKIYGEQVWPRMTLGEFIGDCIEKYGDKIVLVGEDVELSYQELNRKACQYANGLLKAGSKRGDRIVLQLLNCHELVIILFVMFKIDLVPALFLPAHRKSEIKGILEKSGAIAYIAEGKYLGFPYVDMIREVRERLNIDFRVYILGDNQGYKNFCNLDDKNYLSQQIEVNYEEIGLLLLSEGTTSTPKLIPRKHCDYIYVAKGTAKRYKIDQDSIYLVSLPIAHNLPLCCPEILGTLFIGGKVVLCPVTNSDGILSLTEEGEVTITGPVPAMANIRVDFTKEGDYDISSLKVLQVGGSVLEEKLAEKIEEEFDRKLQQIFRIAEGLTITTSLDNNSKTIFTTQGKPISESGELLVVDEDEEEVKDEEYGGLIVRGSYTICGYYELPEVNRRCISKDLYFRTGDKTRRLEDENYQVVGGISGIISRVGEKVTPSEIEDILLSNGDIGDVRVIRVPNELLGGRIGVFILKDGKDEPSLEDIKISLANKNVTEFKLLDFIKYINS